MKKVGSSAGIWCLVSVVVIVLCSTEVRMAGAVTCRPVELSSCAGAVMGSQSPSSTCCSKLREQRPCLCGYLRDPSLRGYVNSPGARRVAAACGVPTPSC